MKRILSVILATVMVVTMLPVTVNAVEQSEIATNIGEIEIASGIATEFTVNVAASDSDAGKRVTYSYQFGAEESDITSLEIYKDEEWVELPNKLAGTFGSDEVVAFETEEFLFRVNFANEGDFGASFTIMLEGDTSAYCMTMKNFEVIKGVIAADCTALNDAIDDAKAYIENEDLYTADTIAAVKDALEAAEELLEGELTGDDQDAIDAAEEAIADAIAALLLLADTSEAEDLVAQAETKDKDDYTAASWESFEEALDALKDLLDGELSENDEDALEAAVEALEDAMDALVELADTSALTAKVNEADAIVEELYSAATYADVAEALEEAKALLENELSVDDQAEVDAALAALTAAINGLKRLAGVSVSATAVASDVTAEYGKADSIVLVFGTALGCDADDVLDAISIADEVASAQWIDSFKTVLMLKLVDDYTLTNDAVIAFSESEAVVTADGAVVSETETVVVGNLEDVSEKITANAMTATIVKGSAKPGVNAEDKVVLVFNAPVKNTPAEITITSDASSMAMKAVKDDTMATVYVINTLDTSLVDSTKLTYGDIANVELLGSFGVSVAPVVNRILIVDNNGTAKTEGDNIIISFNIPTNGVELTTEKVKSIIEKDGQGLGTDFTAVWNDAKTEITITVGKTATLDDNVLFNLGGLGIMDEYETCRYEGKIIAPVGSFGTSVAPKITRAIAFTQGTRHIIRVFFNTEIEIKGAMSVTIDKRFKLGADYSEKWTDNGITYYDLTLGEDHGEFESGKYTISFDGVIADKESGKTAEYASAVIYGGFEQDIEPEILSLTAYSNDGSGVAKKGDKIVLVLNSEVTKLSAKYDFASDDNVTWIYTLKNDGEVAKGEEITFAIEALGKDYTLTASVAGSFGYTVEAKLLSAIASSKDGSGIAKKGDEIIINFNAPVSGVKSDLGEITTSDNITYIITLDKDESVSIGDKLVFADVVAISTGTKTTYEVKLGGSFGKVVEPKLISATAYSNDGSGVAKAGDTIVLVFNTPVEGVVSGLGTVSANANSDNMVWTITLSADNSVAIGTTLSFPVTAIATGKEKHTSVALGGSFGEIVAPHTLSITAISNDGSGIAKKGDTIVAVFNTEVTVERINDVPVQVQTGYTYTYTLKNDNEFNVGDAFVFTVVLPNGTTTKYTLNSDDDAAVIGGSFGEVIVPKLLSVTAYSLDGSGIAKKNDKIIVIFDTPVTGVTSTLGEVTTTDNMTFVITLKENNKVKVGNELKFNVTSIATGEAYDFTMSLGGTFGEKIDPKLISATVYSNDGSGVAKAGDKIVVIFNTPVTGVLSSLGNITTTDNTTFVITLKENNSVKVGDELAFGVTSIATGEAYDFKASLGGTLGEKIDPKLISVTAYSNDGSGIAKKGDKIIVIFNTPVSGVTSNLGEVATTDNTTFVITLKEKNSVKVGDELKFNVTAIATGEAYDFTMSLGGTFGEKIDPKLISATAYSNDGSGIAKKNDTIVVIFNTPVSGVTSNLGNVTTTDNTTFVITLKENNSVNVGDKLTFNVTAIATGEAYNFTVSLGGTFGYSEMPTVKSVVLSESNNTETITVTFDRATNGESIDTHISAFYANNTHLGTIIRASWEEGNTVLKITLSADATTTSSDKLNLSGIGIKDANTGKDVEGIDSLEIKGSLVPVVGQVVATEKTITINFSARTNGVASIAHLTGLLGTGATAEWSDNNKTLTITLGKNYTITTGGYIVLNGMGIKDGFSGTYRVVGQYQITGSVDTDTLTVSRVVAQSTNPSTDKAGAGDNIIIKFNSATDLGGAALGEQIDNALIEKLISVDGDNEAAFGTGYSAMWTAYDTLVITLGGKTPATEGEPESGVDPAIAVGDKITVSGIAFANGEGEMETSNPELTGSFDGREFVIKNGEIGRINDKDSGDYRISAEIENTLMMGDSTKPTIVCVAFKDSVAVGISRITIDIDDVATPIFEFAAGLKITSAKIYVFSDSFANSASSPAVLATPVEVKLETK